MLYRTSLQISSEFEQICGFMINLFTIYENTGKLQRYICKK
uniref:Uncharacterized protein n=1 Tax=Arundo donax TaxID=35708 RepID=A0A0A9A3N5_ARUDO